jgi:hypothetical protein
MEAIHTPTLKYCIGGSVFALQIVLSACNVVWNIVQMFLWHSFFVSGLRNHACGTENTSAAVRSTSSSWECDSLVGSV